MIKKLIILFPLTATLIVGCGGGGGGGSIDADGNGNINNGEAVALGAAMAELSGLTPDSIQAQAAVQAPAVAAALPATEVPNATPDLPLNKTEAFRLLDQATFGANLEGIERLDGDTAQNWIDEQLTLPATFMSDGLRKASVDRWSEYTNVWWRMAVEADDQLRQRVAFALSEIFVISSNNGLGDEQPALANYYDILVRNAFGNYRDLVEEITLSPVMGEYLSMKGNQKPNVEDNLRPDENYARELLQLFSIGLSMLNDDGTPIVDAEGVPVPTYNQADIEAFAHVFTGWHFANVDNYRWPTIKDFITPMQAYDDYHDKGEKQLLNGFVVPAGQSAEADMKMALDNIANHSNVGPFIVKQLIQRLVTSNPSPDYVSDVVQVFNNNANGERGNLGSTVKAILMHDEARSGHLNNPDVFGKLKEPLMRITQIWRAFAPSDGIHPEFDYSWALRELQQAPLESPTVFNFFTPSFAQPGAISANKLVSPEFEIIDESSIITITSRLLSNTIWAHNFKISGDGQRIAISIDREMDLEPDNDELLDHLDLLLLGGRMTDELRQNVQELMDERDHANGASTRVAEAIFLIISSPEAAIQL